MKNKILHFSAILILIFAVTSCEKDNFARNENNNNKNKDAINVKYELNDSKIYYYGETNNKSLTIDLLIENNDKSKSIHELLEIDISDENYIRNISNSISERAFKLSKIYSLEEIEEISELIKNLINVETKKINQDKMLKIETQGLFMFYSLAKATKRIIQNGNKSDDNITFTAHSGFELGLTPFIFDEDIIINVNNFISFINENPDFSKEKGSYVIKEVLECYSENYITNKQLLYDIDLYVEKQATDKASWWPKGSDYGCCGNYSGPCYFWHPVCYLHDVMCSNCEPEWFCLSGCVPDAVAVEDNNQIITTETTQNSYIFNL